MSNESMQETLAHGQFLFSLNEQVDIGCSGERGHVIARANYVESANQYLLRYKAADGRAVEAWWSESALISAT